MTYTVYIMLLVYRFATLTIWYYKTNWHPFPGNDHFPNLQHFLVASNSLCSVETSDSHCTLSVTISVSSSIMGLTSRFNYWMFG